MFQSSILLLLLLSIASLTGAANKRCSYTFRVPVEDMHAGCSSSTPPQDAPQDNRLLQELDPKAGAAGGGGLDGDVAEKLLASIEKLVSQQLDMSRAEQLVKEMNATVNEQDSRYKELVLRTRMLSSQLNILTSGYTKGGGTDSGIFPNYKGITNLYTGCPIGNSNRVHEIAPIRKIYEEIIRVVPHSCHEWQLMGFKQKGSYQIDPDGIEGTAPFNVDCIMSATETITMVKHTHINRTQVLGFEAPGSYVADIDYHGILPEQLKSLIRSSSKCEQYLKYECKGSTLSNEGWWVSIDGEKQNHWAGGSSLLGGCACNIDKTCTNRGACHCDSNDDSRWLQDAGYITDMDKIPVTRLQFGDTGSPGEEAYFTLGPLRCYSDAVSPYAKTNAFMPLETWPPFHAFCDFDGWLLIMRHSVYGSVDFSVDLDTYKNGFGDLQHDFWLGLDKIYQLTNQQNKWYALQISIDNGSGVKYFAKYDYFKIANATDQYRLHVSGYSGTAPDELHNMDGMVFSTIDADGDAWQGGNCAEMHGGGWWWYDCGYVMLTTANLGWGGLTDVDSVEMKIKLSEFN